MVALSNRDHCVEIDEGKSQVEEEGSVVGTDGHLSCIRRVQVHLLETVLRKEVVGVQ